MPITCAVPIRHITQDEWARLDYKVMARAFDSHNEIGRLCDEVIYQNDLAARLRSTNIQCLTEVPLTISHGPFQKIYSIDLLVESFGIYELKTSRSLTHAHESQLLNYLFLTQSSHGKLINFRPSQLEPRFVNTAILAPDRYKFTINLNDWIEREPSDKTFREVFTELLSDWGLRLDLTLYAEAMIYFAGGAEIVNQLLPLIRNGVTLGGQKFNLVNPSTAFRLTAFEQRSTQYECSLRALLKLTPLTTIHWINLSPHEVHFTTLSQ
jgi:GxxExxY protein